MKDRIRMEGKSKFALGLERKKEEEEREICASTDSMENIVFFF